MSALEVWKKLIATLMDDFEGFRSLVEEVTAEHRKGSPKTGPNCCCLMIKLSWLLLADEQRKQRNRLVEIL